MITRNILGKKKHHKKHQKLNTTNADRLLNWPGQILSSVNPLEETNNQHSLNTGCEYTQWLIQEYRNHHWNLLQPPGILDMLEDLKLLKRSVTINTSTVVKSEKPWDTKKKMDTPN